MKVISKEEEDAHYSVVVRGGLIGGTLGLAAGVSGVLLASRRYPAFRGLTLPFRTFLVSSVGTFGAIINAERYSVEYQRARDPMSTYRDASQRALDEHRRSEKGTARALEWGREHRYSIVFTSWIAAMGLALAMVGKNKYMSTSQKLVQARVYAQGLTLAVLIATAALETADAKNGKGRWETVMVLDPNDPTHQHLIEKRVEKEDYEGQNLWKGEFSSFVSLYGLDADSLQTWSRLRSSGWLSRRSFARSRPRRPRLRMSVVVSCIVDGGRSGWVDNSLLSCHWVNFYT